MKKISILLMLMALFGPLAMMGQTRLTVNWGSDSDYTGTTSYAYNSPFGRYYGWEYKVFCYRPNTLPFSGDISQIAFLPATDKNNAGTNTSSSITINGVTDSNPMQIWMKEVSGDFALDASIAFSNYASGATKVYSGNIPATTSGTMTSFTLSTSFTHSQENSLLILVRTVANGATGDSGAVNAYYKELTGGVNLCWYQQQDSSDPGANTTADGVITNNLPVLQVTYSASSCEPQTPTNVAVNNVTHNSASVSWTGGNNVNVVQYVDLSTATLTLSSETVNVLTQGFEGGSIPTGWTSEGDATWSVGVGDYHTTTGPHNGSYNAKITHSTRNNVTYLVTPAIDLSNYGNAKVSCWYTNREWPDDIDGFGVYYRVNNGAWQELFSTTTAHSTYTQTEQLSLPSEANVQVGFKFTDNYGYGVALDDILITANPYDYTWTTASSSASSPYTLSGLDPETDYLVRVKGVCNGVQSAPSTSVSFTTEEAPATCAVTLVLNDAWGDGWNGGKMEVVNANTNEVLGSYTLSSGSTSTETLDVIDGTTINFVYTHGNYAYENGFVLTAPDGTVIAQHEGCSDSDDCTAHAEGVVATYTMNCNACVTPKNFQIVGTPGADNVQLSWTAGGSETAWRIMVTGGMTNAFTVTTSDLVNGVYTLSGLSAGTEYNLYLSADCGDNEYSDPAGPITFVTDSNCPKPTNLTVSNLAASHATVSWDSEAGNYTVKYSTATVDGTTLDPVFEDGFENGSLNNWTTYAIKDSNPGYTDWQAYDMSRIGSNGVYETNHTGSYSAMSRSWTGTTGAQDVDNWLVTPQMTLGNTVKFWVNTNAGYPDSYAVYVSTGSGVVPSSGTGDFVVVANLSAALGEWTEKTYDISAYAGQQGYVAIRHKDNDKDFLCIDDFGVYNTINTYSYGGWTTVSPNPTTESCQITGLSAETLYEVQVQANCGGTDGSSAWSTIHFTTPDNCGAPQELATSNITATSATLSWADDKDSYNLQYRKVYFHEGFESETMPTGWTTVDSNNDGLCWHIGSSTAHSGVNGVCNSSFVYSSDFSINTTPDDYLISPQLDLQGTLRVWLSGYPRSSSNYSEHFEILLSTTGTSVSDFTTTLVAESTTTNSYVEYTADLSSYTGKGYIAIHHFNCTDQNYLYVDDFGLYGSENWVALNPNPTTETANLTGLTPTIENENHLLPTTYEWQVQGVNCDGNGGTTEWSDVATFTTLEGYVKNIIGYGSSAGGYYLIASPIGDVAPTDVTNMINSNHTGYDLFYFDQSRDMEWVNYKPVGSNHFHSEFGLVAGKGYLYARKLTADLVFTGPAYSTQNGTQDVTLAYSATSELGNNADLPGWNLVGNPFGVTAYVDRGEYYTMNSAGSEFVSVTVNSGNFSVEPMEGIFVIAEQNGETMTFSTTEPQTNDDKGFALNLSQDRGVIDRAIVRFGQGRQLPKFQLNPNHTKVYIPVDGKDYAVVRSEEMGAMPVNFKAENNGTYTLGLSTENAVGFAYLHLIDNMTGMDIDLLQTPSYTFEAKTTDYESRFKLVYATGNNSTSDNFAFFSNGSFVINNDGNATLQVIDIMGRIVKSESINGCANMNVNAAPGVYMLRLVNGDNVKVQKVVVR